MEVWEIYARAVDEYKAKNFDAALKILDEIKRREPTYRKAYLLESYIWQDKNNFVKQFDALTKFFPLLDMSEPAQKNLAAVSLEKFANACRALSLHSEAIQSALLSAKNFSDDSLSCAAVTNAIFSASCLEKNSRGLSVRRFL